ncbi:MAG: YggT family protein [Sideroxydans sp.]|nr:YggT family protein [Sideroxydans sp.]
MLTDTMQFVLDVLLQSYAGILLLRFHLQWLRSPLRNPLGEFIMLLTNPLVLRARRFIPAAWGLDTATLLLACVVEIIYLAATLSLHSYPVSVLPLFAWTLVKLIKISVYLLMAALFIEALLSWTNPNTPLAAVLDSITRPFLLPFRRFVPSAGNIDFSFLVLFFICQIILMLPLAWLEGMVLEAL